MADDLIPNSNTVKIIKILTPVLLQIVTIASIYVSWYVQHNQGVDRDIKIQELKTKVDSGVDKVEVVNHKVDDAKEKVELINLKVDDAKKKVDVVNRKLDSIEAASPP